MIFTYGVKLYHIFEALKKDTTEGTFSQKILYWWPFIPPNQAIKASQNNHSLYQRHHELGIILAFQTWMPFANTYLPSLSEGYGNRSCFLLVEEQGLDLAFTPSSDLSLDVEVALQHLSRSCNSELSSIPSHERDALISPSSSSLGMEATL
ncbi:hypothetical protein L7F22_055000 [Adiantum nelumboides]|nr:hypothetical protein [Adiantum nelumboides]